MEPLSKHHKINQIYTGKWKLCHKIWFNLFLKIDVVFGYYCLSHLFFILIKCKSFD